MPAAPVLRRRRLRRTATILLIAAVALAVVGYFAAMPVLRTVLRDKLQRLVSDYLYARLEMGTLSYRFPYGVIARDVRIVTTQDGEPETTLASSETVYLQLGKLPLGDGPLVIETIDLATPTFHVIATPEGIVGQRLLRPRQAKARRKLSDVLQLRHVQVTDARVRYDDRTRADSVPLVWEHLNLKLQGQRRANDAAAYDFDFFGSSGALADVAAAGGINVDTGLLRLDRLRVDARLDESPRQSPLPAEVQAVLRRSRLAGRATFEASGTLPLGDPKATEVEATFAIDDARGVVLGGDTLASDVGIGGRVRVRPGSIAGRLDRLSGRTDEVNVRVAPLNFSINTDANAARIVAPTWTLSPLSLVADYRPPPPHTATRQPMTLTLAASPSIGPTPGEVRVDFTGTTLAITGAGEALRLRGLLRHNGRTTLLDPVTIDGLGGQVRASGTHALQTNQSQLVVNLDRVSVAALGRVIDPGGEESDALTGQLSGQVSGRMTGDDLATLTAAGDARVTGGRFGDVPLLTRLAAGLRLNPDLFVARDAAARFTLADGVVTCERLSVSTDAVRVRGQGTIGLDRTLDLSAYAGAAGDWGESVRDTGIPLLSRIGGAIAGGTQGALRAATRQLTTFRITGTLDEPKVTPTPLPAVGRLWDEN